MKHEKYAVDAVVRRHDSTVGGMKTTPVSVLGCGMRHALPMILHIVGVRGSYALKAYISETEATVAVPSADADKVFYALASLLTESARVPDPRNKE